MATEADQVIVEFTEYFNAGDLDGLLSMYEEGAILASSELVVGDLALTHSRWRFEVPGEEPQECVSAEVARRQPDGTWKYVIDNPYGEAILG